MSIFYIALKHVIWRFQICYYCRKIFKIRNFMNNLTLPLQTGGSLITFEKIR